MGASVQVSTDDVTVKRKDLKAFHADLSNCIDLLPTAAVLAALAEGTTELHGIQRARLKESNRVKSVKENLLRAGIKVTEQKDRLTIRGGSPQPAVIDSYNDHRIAMAFSLLGAAAGGITIQGAECVSKTYPDYWNVIRDLGVKTNEQ
jgi:3-phosphoshikimate 1-carboxyvinyltransferase